ncbi:hypothetical protein [Streptosporangium sp. NPDC000396]|uniref:hypothetical protein n=1 Tax=Streptosporangium sp. NPDC000396 TaxID=3366185 RepID=UPI0036BAC2ED
MDIVRAVPVEFLTDEQAAAYGTFAEVPMRSELERFVYLDDVDRDLIALAEPGHINSASLCSSARCAPSAFSWKIA